MSTRAVFTFNDEDGNTFHIYKHCDGYPSNAAPCIRASLQYSWQLPRFEASEFAAAFVAANKERQGGNVYLTTHWKHHGDLEYRYEISLNQQGQLQVKAFEVNDIQKCRQVFDGDLAAFEAWAVRS